MGCGASMPSQRSLHHDPGGRSEVWEDRLGDRCGEDSFHTREIADRVSPVPVDPDPPCFLGTARIRRCRTTAKHSTNSGSERSSHPASCRLLVPVPVLR